MSLSFAPGRGWKKERQEGKAEKTPPAVIGVHPGEKKVT